MVLHGPRRLTVYAQCRDYQLMGDGKTFWAVGSRIACGGVCEG